MAELCSHQVNAANWFLGSSPDAVIASGGFYRFPENREVYDHVYVTFEHPGGRTAVFSSIESNAFDDYYEMHWNEGDVDHAARARGAPLRGGRQRPSDRDRGDTGGERCGGAVLRNHGGAHEPECHSSRDTVGPGDPAARPSATRLQMRRFCSAIRVGTPLACGPDKAIGSASACIGANEAIKTKARVKLRTT